MVFLAIKCSCFQVYKTVELIKAKGGKVSREPGPVKGGNSVIAFVEDPDGYKFELIQRGPTPEPLCQVMLRVGDLDRAIKFYENVCIFMSFCIMHRYDVGFLNIWTVKSGRFTKELLNL